jgi:hypothetical protein
MSKKPIPLNAIVEVTWEDAITQPGDMTFDDILKNYKPCIRHSVGYLVRNDRKYVTLAATDDRRAIDFGSTSAGVADVTVIPRRYVSAIRLVEKPPKKV